MEQSEIHNSLVSYIQKLVSSSLSFPTRLSQLMGYLPLTFNRNTNSLSFKYVSIPFLIFIVHMVFDTCWILFYFFNIQLVDKVVSGNSINTLTLRLTYLGSIFITIFSSALIRFSALINRKRIQEFYSQFNRIISSSKTYVSDVETFKDCGKAVAKQDKLKSSLNGAERELRPVWICMAVTFIATSLGNLATVAWAKFQKDVIPQHQSIWWMAFGSLGYLYTGVSSVLYAALLLWITRIVECIRIAFQLLLEEMQDSFRTLHTNHTPLEKEYGLYMNPEPRLKDNYSEMKADYFISSYTLLEKLMDELNKTFNHPIIITLAGLCCYFILHAFALITALVQENLIGILASSLIISAFVWMCVALFLSICDASERLNDQVQVRKPSQIIFYLAQVQVN
jgi:hypothetical protein